jgi:hypothetical protein
MATKNYWIKFYPGEWGNDKNVQAMTLAERGAYITLLQRQMIDGYVLLDDQKEMGRILKSNEEALLTPEEVAARLSPIVRDRFKPIPEHPERYINKRMAEEMDFKGKAKYLEASSKADKQIAAFNEGSAGLETGKTFDFNPILRSYPHSKWKESGWKRGVQIMVSTITSDDEYDRLWAAVKNYAATCKAQGRSPDKIMKLSNFMSEWGEHVPKSYDFNKAEREESPPVAKIEVETVPVSTKPKGLPWEQEGADSAFWNEDNQIRFLAGDDPRKDKVS